jgi:hypothetical protein
LNKYRRIEVRAFRHRTAVSNQSEPDAQVNGNSIHIEDCVQLSDVDLSELIEHDSLEGQRILLEALRSIERRLTSETRTRRDANEESFVPNG